MLANNEIGTLQPLQNCGSSQDHQAFCTRMHAKLQAMDLDEQTLSVDLLTLNRSKIYGPKGVGILYLRKGVRLKPIILVEDRSAICVVGQKMFPTLSCQRLWSWLKINVKQVPRLTTLRTRFAKFKAILNGHPRNACPTA